MPDEDEWFYRCPSGYEHLKAGRRFMRRLPAGTLDPDVAWTLTRGCVPDAGAAPGDRQ